MKSRKDLQRMEFALKQIKNPPQEVPMAASTTAVDKKVVNPKKEYRKFSEQEIKAMESSVLTPEPGNLTVGGKRVSYTDKKGNAYDEDKNRLNI